MTRLTFSRERDGTFNLAETRLSGLVDALFDGNSEPRIPVSMMNAATRELVSAIHKVSTARNIAFHSAAGLLVRERPNLFKLTRGIAVHDKDSTADVELA